MKNFRTSTDYNIVHDSYIYAFCKNITANFRMFKFNNIFKKYGSNEYVIKFPYEIRNIEDAYFQLFTSLKC